MPQFIAALARNNVKGASLWREKVREYGVKESAKLVRDNGILLSGYCWAGLISSPDKAEADKALDEVRRAFDEAAEVKSPCVVFVAGPVDPRDKNLAGTRARVLDRIATIVPYARSVGVKIALEPLHPMICATRTVLSTMKLGNDWCDALKADDIVGLAVDVYAVWWDPDVEKEIARAGKRICAFHVNDWIFDTQDIRLDRGMMGDGLIDIPHLRKAVDAAGYNGLIEVEIFSAKNWWKRPPDEVIRTIKERIVSHV
jgi:sugar phosphate isomerase/epimerase